MSPERSTEAIIAGIDEAGRGALAGPVVAGACILPDGIRLPRFIRDSKQLTPETRAEAFAWIGLYRPSPDEVISLAEEFDLHELAVEDAIVAHQRPKLERYDETLFVVLSAARYLRILMRRSLNCTFMGGPGCICSAINPLDRDIFASLSTTSHINLPLIHNEILGPSATIS